MAYIWASNLGQYSLVSEFCAAQVGSDPGEVAVSAPNFASVFWSNGNGKAMSSIGYDRYGRFLLPSTVAAGQVFIFHGRYRTSLSSARHFWGCGEGATVHVSLAFGTDGSIQAYRSISTALSGVVTAANVVQNNVSFHLGVEVKVHDTAGYIKIWVNGALVLSSATNLDTRNAGAGTVTSLFLGGTGAGSTGTGGTTVYLTDLVLLDDTGAAPLNAFLGAVRYVLNVTPANGGSGVQFTPLASTNASQIDDPVNIHDGDTTYNSTAVAGNKDHFTFGTWTGFSGTIKFVHMFGVCRTPDAGTHTARLFGKNGGTYDNGASFAVPSSYGEFHRALVNDPATTAAWANFAAVAAAEFGYEMVT